MTNDEFLFWLWGWFEISERDPRTLGSEELKQIEKHVELVNTENLYTSPFVSWLRGVLDITQAIEPENENNAYEVMTNLIYERLKLEFERKAEKLAILKDRPELTFPDRPILPHDIIYTNLSKKVCTRLPDGISLTQTNLPGFQSPMNNLHPDTPHVSC